ncbi:hypothetical protein VB715_00940 [Crocosphaera sp. UHCC 0190]|uniref:hypothetical protein n=1 Tax=Crocosphaera sp. UHCC 0190 TaxID=3110246 RepID=UPI002B1F4E43|nr:hypothetical protein [Crocosphaera sp. UHCC 0190]MEA5508320.1 hypothetical protein [Crocosphaera sp. UHCC 0190]
MELLPSEILATNKFDQCVLNLALINICNQESYIGQGMKQRYNAWKSETDEAINNPWLDLHQFTIYVPHPDQKYENMTLEEGLTLGYNLEVEPVLDRNEVPYDIPEGGHFVVILKQHKVDDSFRIAATGIFVRPLALFSLDVVTDPEEGKYHSLVVQHPIIRDYPGDLQQKLLQFVNQEINMRELPNVVGFVDQAENSDYRQPSWQEMYLEGQGLKLF